MIPTMRLRPATPDDLTHLIPDHLDGEAIDPAVGRSDDSE